MDPIVLSAGTALVGAIATDTWERARAAVVALWRRARPDQADVIDEELAESRRLLLTAREEGDTEAEPGRQHAHDLRHHRPGPHTRHLESLPQRADIRPAVPLTTALTLGPHDAGDAAGRTRGRYENG